MQNTSAHTSETQVSQPSDNSIAQSPNYVKSKFLDRDYSKAADTTKKIEASPSLGSPKGVLNRMLNAFNNSIAQSPNYVKK